MKPYFEGKIVNLRGICKTDYTEGLYNWANTEKFNKLLSSGLKPSTKQSMETIYNNAISDKNVLFAITNKNNHSPKGLIGLYNIIWQSRLAEYRIHLSPEIWGTGASFEASIFIINYAFSTLNLNKVWLGMNKEQINAVKLYNKLEFTYEGELRQEIFRNNRYYNAIRMSMLKSEWSKIHWSK